MLLYQLVVYIKGYLILYYQMNFGNSLLICYLIECFRPMDHSGGKCSTTGPVTQARPHRPILWKERAGSHMLSEVSVPLASTAVHSQRTTQSSTLVVNCMA